MIGLSEKEIVSHWNTKVYKDTVVSVICTVYNQQWCVENALDGILMQVTEYPFRIIVHDDASNDGTVDIIRSYEEKYPHIIKAVYQKTNTYSINYNYPEWYCYSIVEGKYVAICEGDDYWTDNTKLQTQISYMEKHKECSMSFHAVNYLQDEKIVHCDKLYEYECDVQTERIIEGGGLFCSTCSIVYTRDYIINDYKFVKKANITDYPMQILYALKGNIHYFPKVMAVYRKNAKGSWSSSLDNRKLIENFKNEIMWLTLAKKEIGISYTNSFDTRIDYDKYYYYSMRFEMVLSKGVYYDYLKKCAVNINNTKEYRRILDSMKNRIDKIKYIIRFNGYKMGKLFWTLYLIRARWKANKINGGISESRG